MADHLCVLPGNFLGVARAPHIQRSLSCPSLEEENDAPTRRPIQAPTQNDPSEGRVLRNVPVRFILFCCDPLPTESKARELGCLYIYNILKKTTLLYIYIYVHLTHFH